MKSDVWVLWVGLLVNFADSFDLLGISWRQIEDDDVRKAVCAVVGMIFCLALGINRWLRELRR